ncbi:hypothetical protein MXD61_06945 [Frankia sp. AgPm24]|uniref:hypothetical protein n=1 Tax=Frankia sp. AgPm24 TaxID=631128 RepID=UPI00200CE574|nr:hypothetical protein [Frankia sp. AgPm24]MCK9921628.1 hypothetical protein [Frankia sp. AgPm24]
MTAPVRLSPTLPPDTHFNGLLGNVARFLSAPDDPILAVVSLAAVRLVTDVPTGFRVPVIGIREIELSCRAVSEQTLRELLDVARRERVGVRTELPFGADANLRGDDR